MPFTIPDEAEAIYAPQARLFQTDLEILSNAVGLTGVVSGCAVAAQGTPDMTVAVASGVVRSSGTRLTVTGANTGTMTADGTNPRFYMVVITSAGAIALRAGTPAANPVEPTLTAGDWALAQVYVPANDTAINADQIVDRRVFVSDVLSSSEVTTALGYTPANRAGDTFTGAVTFQGALDHDGSTVGFLGAAPVTQRSSTYDLRQGLIDLGLFASGGASPLNLNGGALTAGTVGIGVSPTATIALRIFPANDAAHVVLGNVTYTTDAQKNLLLAQPTVTVTAPISSTIYGLLFLPSLAGTEGVTTNTIANIASVYARVDVGASFDSNITNLFLLRAGNAIKNAGAAGTISNQYGLYVDSLTTATTNWGVYVVGNDSYFGGRIRLGGSAADPASLAAGDHWYNTSQKSHRFQSSAGTQGLVGLLYANTSVPAENIVANTTATTNFASNVSIPANALAVGKVIRVTANGVYGTHSTAPTLIMRLRFGATDLAVSTTTTMTASQTNRGWRLEADLIVISIGATGTVEVQGQAAYSSGTAGATINLDLKNTAVVTVDTTVAQTLQVAVTWGTANASNTITLRQMTVEVLD